MTDKIDALEQAARAAFKQGELERIADLQESTMELASRAEPMTEAGRHAAERWRSGGVGAGPNEILLIERQAAASAVREADALRAAAWDEVLTEVMKRDGSYGETRDAIARLRARAALSSTEPTDD